METPLLSWISGGPSLVTFMKPFLLPGALLALLVPATLAQEVLHVNDGDGSLREHGHALAAAGDVNGDGVGDYWMGAPGLFDVYLGHVYLVSGADGSTLRQIEGKNPFERFGYALAGGEDLSGDGIADVVVGVPRAGLGRRGAVRVFSGADGSLVRAIPGGPPSGRFGEALALIDDRDGDGVADLAIGAPGERWFTGGRRAEFATGSPRIDPPALRHGSVRFHSGATGALLGVLAGTQSSEDFGASLARAGDLDGDGKRELLVGAPGSDGTVVDSGRVLVLAGADGALLHEFLGDASGDRFGHAVSGAGDLDGDGVPDVLVGAPGGRHVRAFSGASGAILWSATQTRPEDSFQYGLIPDKARFGWAVCGLGDQNGDGRDDVAVGYPEASTLTILSGSDGSVLEMYTAGTLHPSTGAGLGGYLGFALAPLGDLDGDGDEELGVGAPTYALPSGSFDNATGRAFVLAGGLRIDWSVAADFEILGRAVSGAGDVDGDGYADVAFSAAVAGIPAVVVTSGRDRSVLRSWSGEPDSAFGRAIARAGDVDADGVEDLVIGSPGVSLAGPSAGAARVYSGATGALLHHFNGSAPGDNLGLAVAGLGDCNGDGHDDVAVSAPRVWGDPALTGFCSWSPPLPGYVRVYSGADGTLLFQVDGEMPTTPWCDFGSHIGEAFGFSLTGVGDWDQDGVPDLAVGAPGAGMGWSGAVRVFSGVDGAQLDEFLGLGGQSEFGVSIAGALDFDFDADGFVDLVVGEEEIYYGGAVSGAVHVISSRDGTRLLSVSAGEAPPRYGSAAGPGYAVAVAGDFDLDGHSDIAVGNPAASTLLGPGSGEVRILSGASGAVLHSVASASGWDYLGYSIANAGDVDGDGRPDLVLGAPTGYGAPSLNGSGYPSARARIRVIGPAKPHLRVRATGAAGLESR